MRLMEESRQDFDIYRCMAGSAVDTHAMEDDDIADLTGALKYVHTEILTEHLQSPIRQTRKYGIDVVTRHRMKFKNPSTVQKTPNALQGEFSQFVTYDFGKATNPAQMPIIKEQVPTSCQYWEGSGISGNICVVCLQNSVWNEIPFIQRKFRRLYILLCYGVSKMNSTDCNSNECHCNAMKVTAMKVTAMKVTAMKVTAMIVTTMVLIAMIVSAMIVTAT